MLSKTVVYKIGDTIVSTFSQKEKRKIFEVNYIRSLEGRQNEIWNDIVFIYKNANSIIFATQELGKFFLLLKEYDIINDGKISLNPERKNLNISYNWHSGHKAHTFYTRETQN